MGILEEVRNGLTGNGVTVIDGVYTVETADRLIGLLLDTEFPSKGYFNTSALEVAEIVTVTVYAKTYAAGLESAQAAFGQLMAAERHYQIKEGIRSAYIEEKNRYAISFRIQQIKTIGE